MSINGLVDSYLLPEQIEYLQQIIGNNQTFLITTHVNPDGDALGSELCLYYLLKALDKQVYILNVSPVPELYFFLDPEKVIWTYKREHHGHLLSQIDVCFVLDIGDWERLRMIGEDLKNHRIQSENKPMIICIDHHPIENKIGDYDLVFPNASSTGEILFFVQNSLKIPLTLESATAIYTSILTDTGSFRFNNTSVISHFIAGILINFGVDHNSVYKQIYEKESRSKIKLLAELLENLHFECDFNIGWYTVTLEMLQRHNLQSDEIEGISDFPRRIQGVRICIFFMEIDESITKVSFRSNGDFPINSFARMFGGGGHPFASGAVVKKPLEDAKKEIIEKICQYYEENS